MTQGLWSVICFVLASVLAAPPASAHGLAGKRFFPATLTIDDPFVADELSLVSLSHIKGSEGKETSIGAELTKTITPDLGISVGAEYVLVDPSDPAEGSHSGFANPDLGIRYKFFQSDEHETVLSLGLSWEIGGVGKRSVGAESFSTLSPALLFGKGLGDLPDAVGFLRPLAVTGTVGADVPLNKEAPNVLAYGVAIEYSMPYLQTHVRDVGLPSFFAKLIPLVEFQWETPLDGPDKRTTGTVNPGVIWAGKSFEVGVEALIPMTSETEIGRASCRERVYVLV